MTSSEDAAELSGRKTCCPKCLAVHEIADSRKLRCVSCGQDLGWLREVPAAWGALVGLAEASGDHVVAADNGQLARCPLKLQTPLSHKAVSLTAAYSFVVGRETKCNLSINCRTVAPRHCLIAREPDNGDRWIIALQSEKRTFVNGKHAIASRLSPGDLVQIGVHAWQYSASDGFLLPMGPIRGSTLHLEGVTVGSRLGPLNEEVPAGEFVAIIGPSGSGKSTLVKAVAGGERRSGGKVIVDGLDVDESREQLRRRIGYVSQQQTIHDHLTARQAVDYAARFRKPREYHRDILGKDGVAKVLRAVDLPSERWDALIQKLSGGEKRRVQTAAELINEPSLFLLDEPASGLDPQRERELLGMLRTLSLRGATVVAVTHGRDLTPFDRPIEILEGGASKASPAISFVNAETAPSTVVCAAESSQDHVAAPGSVYLNRELSLLWGDPWWRLVLPLFVIPLLFSTALHFSVKDPDYDLLGFLSVLSCIWMSASMALTAIVDERRIVEHERLVFLNVIPYLAGKAVVLYGCAAVQALVFFGMLWAFDDHEGDRYSKLLSHWVALPGYLILSSWAAVGLGLVLSALSGFSRVAANLLLPLVMIGQMVYSVEIAGNGKANAEQAYRDFAWSKAEQVQAARASYLTISRYGDMLVRNLLSSSRDSPSVGQRRCWRFGLLGALGLAIGFLLLAAAILKTRLFLRMSDMESHPSGESMRATYKNLTATLRGYAKSLPRQ